MRDDGDCPEENVLQRFLAGRTTPEEIGDLEIHLEECEQCLATLKKLDTGDWIVEALQRRGKMDTMASDEWVRILIEWLKRMSPVLDTSLPHANDQPGELRSGLPSNTIFSSSETPPSVRLAAGESTVTYMFTPPGLRLHSLALTRLGPYEVRTILGYGGMGVVFQAYDPHLERLVALKTMLPSLAANPLAKERFLREAKAVAAIKHDHIVTIYHVGEDSGIGFFAMELLEGESLAQRLNREGRLALRDVLRIARETALGLASAHARGLIHRDIKPGNLWLEQLRRSNVGPHRSALPHPNADAANDRVKILDFGLALSASDNSNPERKTGIQGTPAYLPPEQLREEAVSVGADLFSLGCVIYQMATGQPPFKGGTHIISTLISVATSQPPPPQELNPELPASLCNLIERLLAKAPRDRPSSAFSVVEALQTIEQEVGQPKASTNENVEVAPRRQSAFSNKLSLLIVGLVCGLVLASYFTWTRLTNDASDQTERLSPSGNTTAKVVSGAGHGPNLLFSDRAHAIVDVLDQRSIAGADAATFRQWQNALGIDFHLSQISTRQGQGPALFNAVAVREKNPHLFRFRPDVPDSVRGHNFEMLGQDRFRLLSIAFHVPSRMNFNWAESQVWVQDGVGQYVDGGTLQDLKDVLDTAKKDGRRPCGLFTATPRTTAPFHIATLAAVQDHAWEPTYSLTGDHLLGAIQTYQKQSWRPDILAPYWDRGELRFMMVAVDNEDGPDWRFHMDMTLQECNKELIEQTSRGLFPLTLVSYGNETDIRYAAIWVRYRAPNTPQFEPVESDSRIVADQTQKAISWASKNPKGLFSDQAYAIGIVEDFREIVAATSQELQAWNNGLDSKFRVSSVSSRKGNGPTQFNAVAVREGAPREFRLLLELDDETVIKTLDRLHDEEFRLIGECSNLSGGQELPWNCTQLWVKDDQFDKHWYGSKEDLVDRSKYGKSINCRPISMAGTTSPEGLGCNLVMAPDQTRAWEAFYSLTSEELLTTIEFTKRKGWRPDIISPYWEDGKLQHMLVVVENSDNVDWRFRMDMTLTDYKKESSEQKKLGLFPHSLTSSGNDLDTRYQALFVRFRNSGKE